MTADPVHVDVEHGDLDTYSLGCRDHEDGATVRPGLDGRGITVHRRAFGNDTEDGGWVRCATHPHVRRRGAGFGG